MLTANHISFNRGSKRILNDVSFTAEAGELMVIAGPNGAGKSTLLNVLTEHTPSATGTVLFNGKDSCSWSPSSLARVRSVLPQSFSSSLPFAVEEVVMMGRYPYFKQYPAPADIKLVSDVMQELDIQQLGGRPYAALSGGEQQRVQLARVLVQIRGVEKTTPAETRYLFLDEPVSSLDMYHQHLILQKAQQLKEQGYCVIAVLHDLNLILQYADKVLLLNKGATGGFGKPSDIFTVERIYEVYGIHVRLLEDPASGQSVIVPSHTIYKTNTQQSKTTYV